MPDSLPQSETDYLVETLQTEPWTGREVFSEMLQKLEAKGECREVYHRLAFVLFGDALVD